MTMVTYAEALTRGDPAFAYPDLLAGPYVDPGINKFVVVGDMTSARMVLQNDEGQTSNKLSVTPWWFNGPQSLAPTAFWAMRDIIRYPKAMQTLDGAEHQTVSQIVSEGMSHSASRPEYTDAFEQQVDDTIGSIEAQLDDGRIVDLVPPLRSLRLGMLQQELGLPDYMKEMVRSLTESQIRFLWGYPRPRRSEHAALARTVRTMFDASQNLLDSYLSRDRRPDDTVTSHLAQAVREEKISKGVGYSTLFGLVNAGEGTASATAVNIAHALLPGARDGNSEWFSLAHRGEEAGRVAAEMAHKHSAVVAWQKQAAKEMTLAGIDRSVVVKKGQRLLVVLGAAATDPGFVARDHSVAFSAGTHKCPGEGITYRYLRTVFPRLLAAAPDARLLEEPALTPATLTFRTFSSLKIAA